jgi:hypothetical protein
MYRYCEYPTYYYMLDVCVDEIIMNYSDKETELRFYIYTVNIGGQD